VQGELAQEFCLPAGPHRMKQSWPTRDPSASQQSRHLGAQVRVLPAHRCVGCGSILRSRDHKLAFVAEDLECFVQDRSKLRDRMRIQASLV